MPDQSCRHIADDISKPVFLDYLMILIKIALTIVIGIQIVIVSSLVQKSTQ